MVRPIVASLRVQRGQAHAQASGNHKSRAEDAAGHCVMKSQSLTIEGCARARLCTCNWSLTNAKTWCSAKTVTRNRTRARTVPNISRVYRNVFSATYCISEEEFEGCDVQEESENAGTYMYTFLRLIYFAHCTMYFKVAFHDFLYK